MPLVGLLLSCKRTHTPVVEGIMNRSGDTQIYPGSQASTDLANSGHWPTRGHWGRGHVPACPGRGRHLSE